jgi:hypothetical protein
MIGQTISHFHILEKPPTTSGQVGEVPKCLPTFLVGIAIVRIPTSFVGGCNRRSV